MSHRILVVDDDPHIREVICFALVKAGMTTEIAGDGITALRQFEKMAPDLIVLDVGMPELDGLEVCRELRKKSDVPILFLSARDEEIDRILGLEIGGDDYVTKPFSPRELTSRINVILRRARPLPGAGAEPMSMSHGLLKLDPVRRSTSFSGKEIDLTSIEFSIVKSLLTRPMHVLNRLQILDASHAANVHVSDRTVDSHVRNIRAKFSAAGCPDVIETVHGIGFRLGRCGA
ncbi:response regulator transcription factor [Phyllobacterium sp. YR531]|uniref:response regulator transcription factor n=1 Tax=Phyllobacterium sp. YR531 TaxID=1144343 RepID=UPI00026F63CB|nr:response regulator transcription factor [Phyllobacterium sp. YR531]EJN03863.1 response regulator with CheY-like receiver domain and winged-helix DNA-binding domain [Phyllobacterium sp. YR531]